VPPCLLVCGLLPLLLLLPEILVHVVLLRFFPFVRGLPICCWVPLLPFYFQGVCRSALLPFPWSLCWWCPVLCTWAAALAASSPPVLSCSIHSLFLQWQWSAC
jgi:hypothetical protein